MHRLSWEPSCKLISVLRVASGPRVKLASCKSALNPPVVYSTDRSKAVVPVLLLVLGFNNTSSLVGHFVSSPREREER